MKILTKERRLKIVIPDKYTGYLKSLDRWLIDDKQVDLLLQAQAELTRDEIEKEKHRIGTTASGIPVYSRPSSGTIEYPYLPDDCHHRKFIFVSTSKMSVEGVEFTPTVDYENTIKSCANCMSALQECGYKQIG